MYEFLAGLLTGAATIGLILYYFDRPRLPAFHPHLVRKVISLSLGADAYVNTEKAYSDSIYSVIVWELERTAYYWRAILSAADEVKYPLIDIQEYLDGIEIKLIEAKIIDYFDTKCVGLAFFRGNSRERFLVCMKGRDTGSIRKTIRHEASHIIIGKHYPTITVDDNEIVIRAMEESNLKQIITTLRTYRLKGQDNDKGNSSSPRSKEPEDNPST